VTSSPTPPTRTTSTCGTAATHSPDWRRTSTFPSGCGAASEPRWCLDSS
jgi:hypothetical protein